MTDQLEIDFLHSRENNNESEKHLKKNSKSFNQKCKLVYDRLMKGEELTVLQCANEGIASLPRRKKDITDKGFKISDRWDGNIKVYYMSQEDIQFNKQHEKGISTSPSL